MNKEYYIKLKAKIDDGNKTVSNLNKQINSLEKKVSKLQIKIDAGKTSAVTNEFNTLNKALKSIGLTSQSFRKNFTEINNRLNSSGQLVTKYRNSLGEIVEVTKKVSNNTESYSASISKMKADLEKNVNSISSLNAVYKTKDEILKQLNVDLKDYNKINEQTKTDGSVVEKWGNDSGKVITLTSKLVDGQRLYTGALRETNVELKRNSDNADKLKPVYTTLDNLYKSLGVNISGFTKIDSTIDSSGKTIEKWTDNQNKVLTVTSKLINGQTQYSGVLKQVNDATSDSAKQANTWSYYWSRAFKSFSTYSILSTLSSSLKRSLKEMINVVIELDGSLVELMKVTDLEGKSLEAFTKEAYEAGSTVAKTGKEMVEAATAFAKAGYSESSILSLGKVAAMYTNIADEEIKVADAADMIIAQLKAFDMGETEAAATRVIDVINEVSNNFAVSSADISRNLGIASAVMANAGNSYEQMVALLTAGTEVTRSANRVANGLKTITLRLQGMEDEGEESLELVSKMEGLYRKLGITVYNTDGTLKNTFDLLGSLATVYKDLTAAEKAYVTETIAGKYQAQNAAAILGNWEDAVKSLETAQNSQGSAMKENEKVLDSINGKINAFKSAFEELAQKMINSNLVKVIVDIGTAVLKFLGTDVSRTIITLGTSLLFAIRWLGSLSTAIKGAAAAMIVAKGATDEETAALVKNEIAELKLGKAISLLAAKQVLMAEGTKNATAAQIAARAATLSFGESIKALTVSMLENPLFWGAIAVTGIIALASALDYAGKAADRAFEKAKEASDAALEKFEDAKNKVDELEASLKEATQRMDELESKKTLSFIEESELNKLKETTSELKQQLEYAKLIEQESAKAANRALAETIKKDLEADRVKKRYKTTQPTTQDFSWGHDPSLDENISANNYVGAIKISKQQDIEELMNAYKEGQKTIFDFDKEIKGLQEDIQEYINKLTCSSDAILNNSKSSFSQALNYLELYSMQAQLKNKEIVKATLEGMETGEIEKLQEEQKTQLQDYARQLKEYSDSLIYIENATDKADIESNKLKEDLYDQYKVIMALINPQEVLGIEVDYIADKYADACKELKRLTEENNLSKESLDKLLESYPELSEYIKGISEKYGWDFIDIISAITDEYERQSEAAANILNITTIFKDTMSDLQSKYDSLTSAVDEFNESGYITVDTFKSLMDNSLWQYLDWTEKGLNANTDALLNEADAAKYNALLLLQDAYAKDVVAIATEDVSRQSVLAKQAVNGLKGEIDSLGIIAAATKGQLVSTAGAIDIIKQSAEGKELTDEDIENKRAALDRLAAVYNNVAAGIANVQFQTSKEKSSRTSKDTSKSTKTEKEWWETELEKLKEQFSYNEITIEEYIAGLDNLLGRVEKGSDAWKKINEELQKQRLSKVEDDYKRGVISLDEYIKKLKELIQAYRQGTDAWNDLADKIKSALQEQAKEQKSDLATTEQAAINIIDKEIEKLQTLKEEQSDYYEKLIEDKEKANDETERELELARLQEALANAQKEKTKRVWREGLGKRTAEYKDNYIGQMLEIVKTEVRLNLGRCVYG